MKLRKFFFLLAALSFSLVTQAQNYPKREFRAAWIQTVNGQFKGMSAEKLKQTLTNQLNSLQEAGINAIIFQVRPEADALYASKLEPWSRFLTGVQGQAPEPLWDPMQFMIDECHKRNMEFHAWINPYRVKTTLKSQLAPSHVYNIHPEWFVTYGDQLFFDPALPESRHHISMVVTDIVSRYDVDAIHMDDYFYPYPIKGLNFPDDASFARYGGGFDSRADWRRSNVNLLIKKIHETIRELKPWVKFGVSRSVFTVTRAVIRWEARLRHCKTTTTCMPMCYFGHVKDGLTTTYLSYIGRLDTLVPTTKHWSTGGQETPATVRCLSGNL